MLPSTTIWRPLGRVARWGAIVSGSRSIASTGVPPSTSTTEKGFNRRDVYEPFEDSTKYSNADSTDTLHVNHPLRHRARLLEGGVRANTSPRSSATQSSAELSTKRQRDFGDWSQSAQKLHFDIQKGHINAVEHLEECIRKNQASLEIVRACLDASMERLFQHKRAVKRQEVREAEMNRLARVVLQYVWEDPELWKPLTGADGKASMQICYFAVAEGLEDLLLEWLTIELPGEVPYYTTWNEGIVGGAQWRNYLFRHVLHAHILLDTKQSADEAIESYLKISEKARLIKIAFHKDANRDTGIRVPPLVTLSVTSPGTRLAVALCSGRYGKTSPNLWSAFMKTRKVYDASTDTPQSKLASQYTWAALNLLHPGAPTCDDAITFLRQHVTDGGEWKIPETHAWVPAKPAVFRNFLHSLHTLARKAGRLDDALWIEALKSSLSTAISTGPRQVPENARSHPHRGSSRRLQLRSS